MSFDGAHYPDRAAHEADRMLDEHDERLERADREADKAPARRDYELVRVSSELVEQLTGRESEPVVVVSVNRYEDNTLELVLRTVETDPAQED